MAGASPTPSPPVATDEQQLAFGAGRLFAIPAGGNAPIQFGALQGVSLTLNFQQKTVHGRRQFPIGIYRGLAKLTGRAEFAAIQGAVFSDLFFGVGTQATGTVRTVVHEAQTVAGGAVSATFNATFARDLGVSLTNGGFFERVTSGPGMGQYACNETTGVYNFNTSINGAEVLLSYNYTDAATGKKISMNNGLQGNAPQFMIVFTETFQQKAMTLVLNRCQATRLNMQFKLEDFLMPDFEFMACADSNGSIGSFSLGDNPRSGVLGSTAGGDTLGVYTGNAISVYRVVAEAGGVATIFSFVWALAVAYPSAKIRAVVYDANGVGGQPGALLGTSDEVIGVIAGDNVLPFSTPVELVAGTTYYIGVAADTSMNAYAHTETASGYFAAAAYANGVADPYPASPTVTNLVGRFFAFVGEQP